MAERSRTNPYTTTGAVFLGCSPNHAVAAGVSESENSSPMFAQRTRPSMRSTTCIRWWWLFQ